MLSNTEQMLDAGFDHAFLFSGTGPGDEPEGDDEEMEEEEEDTEDSE
jgi:hypothetical protein